MTYPLGFRYAATYAGIRKAHKPPGAASDESGTSADLDASGESVVRSSLEDRHDDLALIVADRPAQAAAVFTRNAVQAAPVRLSRDYLKRSRNRVSAILVNAGNANCATRTGHQVASSTTKAVADALKTRREYVLPASTGVIGVELEPGPLISAIPKLVSQLSPDNFDAVARAMMTTDTRVKTAGEEIPSKDGTVRVAAMAKGSGMIHPNLATTLAFVMMDAAAPASTLRNVLRAAVKPSFNSLSVDGDMSTNDTVALLASGASRVNLTGTALKAVSAAVKRVLVSLAEQIAADGEGARKLIIIEVVGFPTNDQARSVARVIANSALVKTAIAGSDPNWGRILSAAGSASAGFNPREIDIHLQNVPVCSAGLAVEFDEEALKRKLDEHRVDIRFAHRRAGKGHARFFTCDLTEGYIRINGSYRT